MADKTVEDNLQAGTAENAPNEPETEENEKLRDASQEEDGHVDLVLGAGAQALKDSVLMFGDPLKKQNEDKGSGGVENEDDTEEQPLDEEEHVDMVLGAAAHALHASAQMFGDPLKTSTETTDAKDESQNKDGDTVEDSGGFVCEDEKDVTCHDDVFDIDVRIRLIEATDEKAIRGLIYDGIYVAALNRYILNATERPFFVCAIGLFAVFFSWLFGGVILALFLSVIALPLGIYVYVRYIALVIYRRRHLPDVQKGIYNYWTSTNEGRVMWVAEIQGNAIGSVAVETHSAIVAEMKHLSVAPEWQCLGIGGRLAQHAIAHMKRRRFKKVIAHVLSLHSEAVNMYTKLGFRRTNVRTVWGGFCTLEDFDLNLSTGSRANLLQEEE